MNKVYYLEPDEEITKVVDRIRKSDESGVVLVISRGSSIAQSIINLKLITRNAADHGKAIGIVSTDRVTKNLADQLKVPIFAKVTEAEKADLTVQLVKEIKGEEPEIPVKVNTYRKYDLSQMSASKEPVAEPEIEEEAELEPELEAEEDLEPEFIEDPEEELEREQTQKPETTRPNRDERPARDDRAASKPIIDDSEDDEADFPDAVAIDDESDDSEPEEIEEDEVVEHNEEEKPKFHHSPLPVPKLKEEKGDKMGLGPSSARHQRNKTKRKVIAWLFVIVLIAALAASYVFLPHASASVVLKTADLDKKATFSVDQNQKAIDIGNLAIPGQPVDLEKDQTKTFNSTGKKDVGAKSTGTVTISNSVSTKAVTVSPGAKVTSTDGKNFIVAKGVLVPGATVQNCNITPTGYACDTIPGTIDASVTAESNGDGYNLPAATNFTVGTLKATNKAAFAGGLTKNILFVTDDDLKNAEITMKTSALTDNKTEFLTKASDAGLKVVEKYIVADIISNDANKNANDEADTFQVTAKIKLSTVGFLESDLKVAMIKLVEAQLTSDQMLVNPDKTEPTYEVTDYKADTNVLKVNINFKGKTGTKISADSLVAKIKGQGIGSAKGTLESQTGVVSASINSWPSFLGRLPIMANKIKINFDFQQ